MYNPPAMRLPLAILVLLALPSLARAEGHAYDAQAVKLFAEVVCGTPAPASDKLLTAHCKELDLAIAQYRKEWLEVAMPFIAGLRPQGLPTRVVYPYAGGDLVTALAVFPDATEITTISLESAGDPRRIDGFTGDARQKDLEVVRHTMVRLLRAAFSATTELAASESTALPGQLLLAMVGLRVHGYEPVGLRYFTFEPDGSLRYVTDADVAAWDGGKKKKGKKGERELRVTVFSNAELTFRKLGDPRAPLRVYRHIAANLYDRHLPKGAPLMKHLASLGPVAAMTKAASHLLWNRQSTQMRAYLLGHMTWMLSDATGIPSDEARKAGFVQDTYGKYSGAYFAHFAPAVERAFVALWKAQPERPLPFRFGYFDKAFQSHMLVTRRP
jgi:hypothetical protein